MIQRLPGVNDLIGVNGFENPVWTYPFYKAWKAMMKRAYSEKYIKSNPAYKDVEVCEEWHYLSNFKFWHDNNYIDGYQLDKDLINPESRMYSPENCSYVPKDLNNITVDCKKRRSPHLMGVGWSNRAKKYYARMFIRGKLTSLGYFASNQAAHDMYMKRKRQYILSEIDRYRREDVNSHIYERALSALESRVVNGGIK